MQIVNDDLRLWPGALPVYDRLKDAMVLDKRCKLKPAPEEHDVLVYLYPKTVKRLDVIINLLMQAAATGRHALVVQNDCAIGLMTMAEPYPDTMSGMPGPLGTKRV
jgi:hypothetical protein